MLYYRSLLIYLFNSIPLFFLYFWPQQKSNNIKTKCLISRQLKVFIEFTNLVFNQLCFNINLQLWTGRFMVLHEISESREQKRKKNCNHDEKEKKRKKRKKENIKKCIDFLFLYISILNLDNNHWIQIKKEVVKGGNGYRHRIWTRRYEFNSWTRLIAFHIALIPLGKVWIQLFSLQLWVNSRVD